MRGEFLDLSDGRLYYYAAGTRGAGEPVVFLHGFPTSSHLWGDLVPLMPPGHRLVVVDLLGYGRSDRPLEHDVGIRGHASRTVELLDVLGIKQACLVGHDVGGGIAQLVAVEHPERVSRLCLIDSVGFDDWPTIAARLARVSAPLTRHLPPAMLLSMLRSNILRGYKDHEHGGRSLDLYLRPFGTPEGRDALMSHIGALDAVDTTTVAGSLGVVRAPTAIVWGRGDPFLPVSLGQRLQRAIPGATLEIVDDVCHFTPEEAPRNVADVIEELLSRAGTA
jgi:pimeloyl-ACP methyl ester carboxylesterase